MHKRVKEIGVCIYVISAQDHLTLFFSAVRCEFLDNVLKQGTSIQSHYLPFIIISHLI